MKTAAAATRCGPRSPVRAVARPVLRTLAAAAVLCGPALALAAGEVAATPDTGGMLRGLLGLGLVLALILGAGWAVKRIGPQRLGSHGPMRIVAAQSLGTRERVVLLEIADQWLVIGVAPGSVRALATLPRGETAAVPAVTQPNFSALFNRAIGRGNVDKP